MILSMMVLASQGWAFPIVDQRFLVLHDVNLFDVGGGDDYFTSNTTYRARSAYVALFEVSSGAMVDVLVTDDDGYVRFNNIDRAQQYYLRLYGWHDHNNSGRDLFVRDASGNLENAASAPFFPTSISHMGVPPSTINLSFDAAVAGQEWINAAAIGSWTIRRRPGVFATDAQNGAQYTIIMDDPNNCAVPGGSDAAYCYPEMAVYLDPDPLKLEEAWGSKMTIAHELTHLAQHWALVPNSSADPQAYLYAYNYNAPDDSDCGLASAGHNVTTKEYQSAAILEGMAHYVAAVAFNQTQEDDCKLTPPIQVIWDSGYAGTAAEYSCEGWDPATGNPLGDDLDGVEWDTFEVPAGNYFDWSSPNTGHLACSASGATTNRAVEVDWLRFFWDADNKLGLDTSQIMDAWVEADPVNWDADGGGVTTDDPRDRMEAALVDPARLTQTEWNDWAGDNGIDQ